VLFAARGLDDGGFGEATPVQSLNTIGSIAWPKFSCDGKTLHFSASDAGWGDGGFVISTASATSLATFTSPAIETSLDVDSGPDFSAAIAPDGLLCFHGRAHPSNGSIITARFVRSADTQPWSLNSPSIIEGPIGWDFDSNHELYRATISAGQFDLGLFLPQ
jgi:hypothetical protein